MNTTLTPHRSLYIPDHSHFALAIIRKYQYTTEDYLGLLGLTFRENVGADTLDTAPIFQFLIHLRLQILQLQHVNNLLMGSRAATLQMFQHKLNTNIELQQINQWLTQHESSYINSVSRNNSLTIQLIDRRLQASKILSTPVYGRTIHSIKQTNLQRTFRLKDQLQYWNPIPPSSKQTWNPGKAIIELRRYNSKHLLLNHQTVNSSPEMLIDSDFFTDGTAHNFLTNHSINNYNAAFGSSFVHYIVNKHSENELNEINEYSVTTAVNKNRLNLAQRLQLKVRNHNLNSGSAANEIPSNLLQIDHILLKNLNNKHYYKTELLHSSIHFANYIVRKMGDSTATNIEKIMYSTNLKPNFLYRDANSKVYQQFRIHLIQWKQDFEILQHQDSITPQTNRFFTNRIVKEHLNEQSTVMHLNPTHLEHQTLLNYPIPTTNEYKLNQSMNYLINQMKLVDRNFIKNRLNTSLMVLEHVNMISSWLPVNPIQLEHQSVLNNNFADNTQNDLNIILYSNLNSMQLVDRNSTILQQIKHELNKPTLLSIRSSLSPKVYQKFSLTQSHTQLQENGIKRTLMGTQANAFEETINNYVFYKHNLIQQVVQSHINEWSSQIQYIPVSSVNRLLDQVESESKTSFYEMQYNTIRNYKQGLTLVDRSRSDRGQLLIDSAGLTQLSIFQKASYLKLKISELRDVKNGSGLNPAPIIYSQANDFQVQVPPDLVTRIIRDRIGDLAQIIQLNSNQVSNQLLFHTDNRAGDISSNAQQQVTHNKTELQSLMQQHFQAASVSQSFALKQLDLNTTRIQSTANTYRKTNSGPVTSVTTNLSQLIYKKYSLHLLDKHKSIKQLKRSLGQVSVNVTGRLDHAAHSVEFNNLTEKIVNERIHKLSALILQMPISSTNLLLHQLNMDTHIKSELEKQINQTNIQQRLDLVDRKVIERGGVTTIFTEAYEQALGTFNQLSEIQTELYTVKLEKTSIEQNERSFIQELNRTRNLTLKIHSILTNEAYITGIINAFNKLAVHRSDLTLFNEYSNTFQPASWNSVHSTSYIQQNLTDKIISERIGEVSSVLQLLPDHDENRLFYANHPIMAINQLVEKNTLLHKEKSSLKLIDRKLIDRGLQTAFAVIMLHQGAEQRAALQVLTKGSNELMDRTKAYNQATPILRQVIEQLNDHKTKSLTSSNGPVSSYLTSLSPLVYEKFWYRTNPIKQALIQQLKRKLSQTASHHIDSKLFYRENLTEKMVRERIIEMSRFAQLTTLTNDKQFSTQAQIQMISQPQQEQEQPITTAEFLTEAASSTARPHLVLVDRNHMDNHIVHTLTERLVRLSIQERSRPEILADRANLTNVTFTERPVSMQSKKRNEVNQKFIEKAMTHLLISNERNESNEHLSTINEETQLVNRRTNQEVLGMKENQVDTSVQLDATLEYLKAKANAAEPVQQSVASILNEKVQKESSADQTGGRVTPITKREFDNIVDRVYKELQKRFTLERQRRGM